MDVGGWLYQSYRLIDQDTEMKLPVRFNARISAVRGFHGARTLNAPFEARMCALSAVWKFKMA